MASSNRLAIDLIDEAIALVEKLLKQAQPPTSTATLAPPCIPPSAANTKPANSKPSDASASSPDVMSLFSKALLKVAKITSVSELANSEKLYKLQVSIGDETKQVCAGLKLYISKEELEGKEVVVIVNLKAAKLAGESSEAMILAADSEVEGKTIVKTLVPPPGSSPGDVIFLQGGQPTTSPAATLKTDLWKSIVALLAVQGGKATCGGLPLVTSKGPIQLPSEIPDGAGIH